MKKNGSTYDEFIKNPKQKKLLNKEYKDLLFSELILAVMNKDRISARKLAKAANSSPERK